jgi:hypothetical protein
VHARNGGKVDVSRVDEASAIKKAATNIKLYDHLV